MLGIIRYDKEGKPICEICGKAYDKLGQHVYNAHNMGAREYKIKFGLDVRKGLTSKKTKEKLQKAVSDNYEKVVVDNLLNNGKKTRFKDGCKGRTKEMVSAQTLAMLRERQRILNENRMKKYKSED